MGAGFRIFQIEAIGNNPLTISPFLRNSTEYRDYLMSINYDSYSGKPAILNIPNYYLNTEWRPKNPSRTKWTKYSFLAGLDFTKKLIVNGGSVADHQIIYGADTIVYSNTLTLTKQLRFFGAHFGIYRHYPLFGNLSALAGLQFQANLASLMLEQRWDSTAIVVGESGTTRTAQLEDQPGRNYFQWQLMIPLGLEYAFANQKFCLRLEANPGIVRGYKRPTRFNASEAHGIGISFFYRPARPLNR